MFIDCGNARFDYFIVSGCMIYLGGFVFDYFVRMDYVDWCYLVYFVTLVLCASFGFG